MTRPLIVLRPEPGLAETLALARQRGLDPVAAPLFEVAQMEWEAPDWSAFDAIVVGSANAFRNGGAQLLSLKQLPVYAVGERTAAAARDWGFSVAIVGTGGLQELIDGLQAPLRLLRLAGAQRVRLRVPTDIVIDERVVYRADPLPLASHAQVALRGGAVVLLHSGEAARRFAAECDRLSIDRAQISLAALAPRIADAAGQGWQVVGSAPHATDARLLAMAADMCQTMP